MPLFKVGEAINAYEKNKGKKSGGKKTNKTGKKKNGQSTDKTSSKISVLDISLLKIYVDRLHSDIYNNIKDKIVKILPLGHYTRVYTTDKYTVYISVKSDGVHNYQYWNDRGEKIADEDVKLTENETVFL